MDYIEAAMRMLGRTGSSQGARHVTNAHAVTGTAVGDSEDGTVLVDLGGDVTTGDGSQYVEVQTDANVLEGDRVDVLLVGESGHGMSPVVYGVPGGGDRMAAAVQDAHDLAASVEGIAQEAAAEVEQVRQDVADFRDDVATTYATKVEREDGDDAVKTWVTTNYTNSNDLATTYATKTLVSQTKDAIELAASQTYETQTDAAATYATKSALTVGLDGIRSEVAEDYQPKGDYATTASMNSAIQQSASSIESSVAATYETKSDAAATYATKTEVQQTASGLDTRITTAQSTADGAYLERTATGTTIDTTGAATIRSLVVEGQSVQDGTPTPDAPVPIVSVESYQPNGCVTLVAGSTRTDIDLQGHALRSLPDGTHDEMAVDSLGHVTMTQRVGEATINGSEGFAWILGTTQLGDKTVVHVTKASWATKFGAVANVVAMATGRRNVICDRLPANGVAYNTWDGPAIQVWPDNSAAFMICVGQSFSTSADFNTWLQSNPLTVLYPLATPQTIDLGTIDLPTPADTLWLDAALVPTIEATWWTVDGIAGQQALDAEVTERQTLIRQFSGGVLAGYVGNSVTALMNAAGSFDVVQTTWSDGTPTVTDTLASFDSQEINIGPLRISTIQSGGGSPAGFVYADPVAIGSYIDSSSGEVMGGFWSESTEPSIVGTSLTLAPVELAAGVPSPGTPATIPMRQVLCALLHPCATYTAAVGTWTGITNAWQPAGFGVVVTESGNFTDYIDVASKGVGEFVALVGCTVRVSACVTWVDSVAGRRSVGAFVNATRSGNNLSGGTEYSNSGLFYTGSNAKTAQLTPLVLHLDAGNRLNIGKYAPANAVQSNQAYKMNWVTIEVLAVD